MILSDRDVFVGVHVTPSVKKALVREKDKQNTTQSALVFKWIVEKLREQGHKVTGDF